MALVLFDTNILIDALKGYEEAINELAYWDDPAISVITWMEVYAGASGSEVLKFDAFMADFGFEIIHIDAEIMRASVELSSQRRRQGAKLALPDAVILATANVKGLTLITRNSKDFKGPNVRIPYELKATTTVHVVNVDPPNALPALSQAGNAKGKKKS